MNKLLFLLILPLLSCNTDRETVSCVFRINGYNSGQSGGVVECTFEGITSNLPLGKPNSITIKKSIRIGSRMSIKVKPSIEGVTTEINAAYSHGGIYLVAEGEKSYKVKLP